MARADTPELRRQMERGSPGVVGVAHELETVVEP
jgi:hypothetical protein